MPAEEVIREGSCTCGAVKLQLRGEPEDSWLCHCTQCRRTSGSSFAHNCKILIDRLEVSGEEHITGSVPGRQFCDLCHSFIWANVPPKFPGAYIVPCGLLISGPPMPKPTSQKFADQQDPWLGEILAIERS